MRHVSCDDVVFCPLDERPDMHTPIIVAVAMRIPAIFMTFARETGATFKQQVMRDHDQSGLSRSRTSGT
jgi:hypothetical protein